jgi:hypothetical protein
MADQKVSLLVNLKDNASKGLEGLKGKLGGFATGANIATVAVLALVAGLTKLAFSTAKLGDDFAKTAAQVGTNAKALSELSFAAQIGGADMSAVATTLRVVSKRVNDANNGLMTSVRSFKQLGIQVRKSNGTMKTAEELIMESADAFTKLKSPVERTALAQELFGRSGTKLIPTLMLGTKGIEELREEANLLGITFSEIEAKQSEEFQDALLRLGSTFKGLGLTIGKQLVPILTSLFTFLKDVMLVIVPAVNVVFQALLGTVKALIIPFQALITAFETLGNLTFEGFTGFVKSIRDFFQKDLSEEELEKKKKQLQEFNTIIGNTGVGFTGIIPGAPTQETGDDEKTKAQESANVIMQSLNQVKDGFIDAHKEYQMTIGEMSRELGANIHATLATTIDSIGTAFGEMLTEGKSFKESMSAIWKDLKKQVIMQIAQMMVKMVAMLALALLLNTLTGGAFAAGGGTSAMGLLKFKDGGIVKGGLEVPSYADGGITNAPQLALIGDNANRREAVVPLPNGRSIPVEMQGGGQSIGQLNILPNASIDEALLAKPVQYWETLVQEKILPAMNNLGTMGETTTLGFREPR